MKRLKSIILAMLLVLSMTSCTGQTESSGTVQSDSAKTTTAQETTAAKQTETQTETQTESSEIEGGFKVDKTKLLDACGNEFVMRGINEAHSWYSANDGESLKGIADAGCNCVRIVCGSGYQYNEDELVVLETLVRVAKNLNLIVILEAHDGTGDDDVEALRQITDYWISVKDVLIGNEAYVILNIANEWYGSWSGADQWAAGYEEAIPKLREAGIKNTIMVDAAGWGQYAQSIADYGMEVFESDPEANTMFSVHMYGSAGKNESTITTALTGATDQGLCVCVGEFGYKHSDGDVDEAFIMQYCTENNIGYLGWSWKGNGGGVEYLDIALDWAGSSLSEDWGEVLINGEYGIKETSSLCSVYANN